MAASKLMMRPVILSRPEKTARSLGIFCVGISVTTVSSGCGAVSAGCGGGGLAGCGKRGCWLERVARARAARPQCRRAAAATAVSECLWGRARPRRRRQRLLLMAGGSFWNGAGGRRRGRNRRWAGGWEYRPADAAAEAGNCCRIARAPTRPKAPAAITTRSAAKRTMEPSARRAQARNRGCARLTWRMRRGKGGSASGISGQASEASSFRSLMR